MSKERPILFSGPMVRAIMEGRKTQTRRVIKPQPLEYATQVLHLHAETFAVYIKQKYGQEYEIECPYGCVGDRLWVRESLKFDPDLGWIYAAGPSVMTEKECEQHHGQLDRIDFSYSRPSCPSIHMPRKASRITLEIVAVRVERLQDISEADAKAEGIRRVTNDGSVEKFCVYHQKDHSDTPWADMPRSAVPAYRELWEQINGPGSWDANPWVWVVEFKRL